jgi:hypothetical protein
MRNPELEGACFAIILVACFITVGILIARGAKSGVIIIALLMPFVYLFCLPFGYGETPEWLEPVSAKLVVGLIASLIAGLLIRQIRK